MVDAGSFFEIKKLYAMSGPGFEPEATIALPSAMIAVMGPAAAESDGHGPGPRTKSTPAPGAVSSRGASSSA